MPNDKEKVTIKLEDGSTLQAHMLQAPTQSLPDLSSPITLKHIGFATSETGGGEHIAFTSCEDNYVEVPLATARRVFSVNYERIEACKNWNVELGCPLVPSALEAEMAQRANARQSKKVFAMKFETWWSMNRHFYANSTRGMRPKNLFFYFTRKYPELKDEQNLFQRFSQLLARSEQHRKNEGLPPAASSKAAKKTTDEAAGDDEPRTKAAEAVENGSEESEGKDKKKKQQASKKRPAGGAAASTLDAAQDAKASLPRPVEPSIATNSAAAAAAAALSSKKSRASKRESSKHTQSEAANPDVASASGGHKTKSSAATNKKLPSSSAAKPLQKHSEAEAEEEQVKPTPAKKRRGNKMPVQSSQSNSSEQRSPAPSSILSASRPAVEDDAEMAGNAQLDAEAAGDQTVGDDDDEAPHGSKRNPSRSGKTKRMGASAKTRTR